MDSYNFDIVKNFVLSSVYFFAYCKFIEIPINKLIHRVTGSDNDASDPSAIFSVLTPIEDITDDTSDEVVEGTHRAFTRKKGSELVEVEEATNDDSSPNRSPKRQSNSVYERVKAKLSRSLSNAVSGVKPLTDFQLNSSQNDTHKLRNQVNQKENVIVFVQFKCKWGF